MINQNFSQQVLKEDPELRKSVRDINRDIYIPTIAYFICHLPLHSQPTPLLLPIIRVHLFITPFLTQPLHSPSYTPPVTHPLSSTAPIICTHPLFPFTPTILTHLQLFSFPPNCSHTQPII